ncbi:transcriptional regulator PaaX, partial [Candidatus Roizmanbacteria bacterium]|nr:transcriptional regulator PaaX [Candidatus Roizmanbacteria bacterium]
DEKWDGKWRIVIFDIPEVNKRIRQVLRETLKVLEFWPLQKSVWISKKNYTKELRKWITDLGLSRHVLTFETNDLGNNN